MSSVGWWRGYSQTASPCPLVVFALDEQYALHLANVERVVRTAHITPLPEKPGIVLGVINVEGCVLPVMDVRRRFRLPEKKTLGITDRFIIAVTPRRRMALLVDSVIGVIECIPADVTPSMTIDSKLEYIEGVVKLNDELLLIHDLESFLSLDEERDLDKALGRN
jgi:purine-binding chemotaxis protein CheW